MHWILLITAIALEVTGQTFLKMSHGWNRLALKAMPFVFFPVSFAAYYFALKKINLSIAYAMWSGLGTAAIALIGWLVLNEGMTPARGFFIVLIITGIVGLNLNK